jgi:transcriptional regulator with XRE-family HTH domain
MRNLPRNQTPDTFVQEFGDLLGASIRHTAAPADRHALMEFGEYLLAARTALTLSHCDFARLIGTTEARVHALEAGLLPRPAISEHLLQRIATVLEEDQAILALILGDSTVLPPPPSVAATLPWCSALLATGRLRHFGQLGKQPANVVWSGNEQFLYAKTWITLLYRRSHNLLDRLQAGRLISRIALSRIVSRPLVLWLAINLDRPLPPTTSQGATAWTAENAGIRPIRIAEPIAASPVQREQPLVALVAAEPSAPPKATVVNDAYRIIYIKRSATTELPAVTYLAVNEEELAVIEFRDNATGYWRCVTNGRFDLCPI